MSEKETRITKLPDDGKLQIVEGLTVNLLSGELKNDTTDEVVSLTGKQLGMFLLLSLNFGEVVTYRSLINHVWNDRNALNNHIDEDEKNKIWVLADHLKEKLKFLKTDITVINHKHKGYSLSPIPVED